MKILLCGHACGPDLGSEPGFTWNWAWYLSGHHRVWALVHPQHRAEIEAYLQNNPSDRHLNFVWVSLPKYLDPWDPKAGEKNIRAHYVLWQWAALAEARKLHRQIGFDICHYVSWGTVGWPPSLWKLGVPFVWGPVGGGQTAPVSLRKYLGRGWSREAVRNLRVKLTALAPSLRRTIRNSALILAANRDTKELLEAAGAPPGKVRLFLDSGLPNELLAQKVPDKACRNETILHWSGRLEPRKGLPLALEAVAQAIKDRGANVYLQVTGDGPERIHYERVATKLAIADRVSFLGRIPREQLLSCFRQADALVWTSLQDSFGSVCLEAMSQGLPLLILDHQGVRDFIPSAASWKVPPTNPTATVEALALAMRQIAGDREGRILRARAALDFARSQSWPLRVTCLERLYEQYCRCPQAATQLSHSQDVHPET